MLKKILVTILSSGYSQFVGVCTFLITARFYGVEGRGVYASVTTLATFSVALVGLSTGMVVPYLVVSASGGREEFFRKSLSTMVCLVLALSLLSGLFIALAYGCSDVLQAKLPARYLIVVGLSLPYYMWSGTNDFIFSSAGEIVQQNRIEFINRTAFLVTSFGLILFNDLSLLGYMGVYAAFNLLQMVREMLFLTRRFKAEVRLDLALAAALVRKGLTAHPVTIASLLNTSLSILVLTYYSVDLKDVGYFNFVCQLTAMIAILPIVVNRYLLSEITAHGAASVWKAQKRIMLYCLLATAAICALAFVLIEPFCRVFKQEFVGAVTLFRMILVVVVPSSFCILMQNQWYSSGRFKLMSITNVSVGVAGAALTFVTIPRFHEFGAAITTIVSYSVLCAINLVLFVRIDRQVKLSSSKPQAAPPKSPFANGA